MTSPSDRLRTVAFKAAVISSSTGVTHVVLHDPGHIPRCRATVLKSVPDVRFGHHHKACPQAERFMSDAATTSNFSCSSCRHSQRPTHCDAQPPPPVICYSYLEEGVHNTYINFWLAICPIFAL